MNQTSRRILAGVLLGVAMYFALGVALTLISLGVLTIVYVRYTPHNRFTTARTARVRYYAQLNPVKQLLSALRDAWSSENAPRFYDVHQELTSSLPKYSQHANSALSIVKKYIAWHQKRYGGSNSGKEESNAKPKGDTGFEKKNYILDTFIEMKAELSYSTEVEPIDPIPLEDERFFDKTISECSKLFEESLSNHNFAMIYEQHRTRTSLENMTASLRSEVAAADRRAAAAESAANKASRQARSAKRKADQGRTN
ncbi:MAG: hypothetical protein OXG15_05035 [Gammaproteobacteria bacterium]|nr:hypothetical protein [Gammaproteobacteria bacterium]